LLNDTTTIAKDLFTVWLYEDGDPYNAVLDYEGRDQRREASVRSPATGRLRRRLSLRVLLHQTWPPRPSPQRDETFPTSSRPAHGAGARRLCGAACLLSSPRLAAPGGALRAAGRSKEVTRRSKTCLRRGRSGSRLAGAPFTSAGREWLVRESSHPVCRRPRQSRADAVPGVQVVRTVARSTWTPGTTPAPRRVGRRQTGWELR
jgi:hypothetical protein